MRELKQCYCRYGKDGMCIGPIGSCSLLIEGMGRRGQEVGDVSDQMTRLIGRVDNM